MKSADPEIVKKISKSLDKTPIDTIAILDQIEVDADKYIVSTILDSYITVSNNLQSSINRYEVTMAENNRLMEELKHELQVYKIAHTQSEQSIRKLQSTENNRINQTTLAKFFLNHKQLLADYSLGEDNLVYCNGELLTAASNTLLYLSLDLEQYFGTRNISLSVLINGIKRYLVCVEKQDNDYREVLLDIVAEYFVQDKGRPRTRIPLKYLRTACKDVPELNTLSIKSLMYEAGFPIKTDRNGIVYFYKCN
jgi:hypothetical protein